MKQYRLLVVGAHPDDPELIASGLAMKMIARGHRARFLSMTDGGAGHQTMTREALIARRAAEIEKAREIYGVEYHALPIPDGTLTPSLEAREMLMREIRTYAPDVIVTHRTEDYHPDHRACGQLVMDCSYLVKVPLYCPDVPVPPQVPVILSSYDRFTRPLPFHADIAVDTDEVFDRKLEGLMCHVSQFYEWLALANGWQDVQDAETFEEKTALLHKRMYARFGAQADAFRHLLSVNTKTAETFQWNEYGASMTDELLHVLKGD